MQTRFTSRFAASRFVFGALLGCVVASAFGVGSRAAHADEIAWSQDFNKAVKQAKATNKLVMVDFYTDWCGWCKVLDKKTYPDKNVVRLTRASFIPVKINAEKEGQAAATKYGVRSYPTILFIDGNGAIAGRIGGYAPPGPFAEQMQKISKDARELPAALAKFKQNPGDVASAAKLTDVYASRGDSARAVASFNAVKKADPQNSKGYTAKAANAVGDMYQSKQDVARAVPYFQKAAQTAKLSGDAAYAHMSIAASYALSRDINKAIDALKNGIADPKVSPSDKKEMQDALKQINAAKSPAAH